MQDKAQRLVSPSLVQRVIAVRERLAQHRGIATLAAMALFAAGIVWALGETRVSLAAIDWGWMLALIALIFPALALNAIELRVTAQMLDSEISLGSAMQVTCWAMLANLLPLPGGAILRGAKLHSLGVGAGKSSQAIVAGGALWATLAVAVTLAAVLPWPFAVLPLAAALCGTAVSLVWLAKLGPASFALRLTMIRLALIGLTILRILVIFLAIGLPGSWMPAVAYSGVSVVGTLVGIVPAGLGVTEAMGSVLALLIEASPANAFLALSINRVVGLAAALAVVAAAGMRPKENA
ncbi:hypothetical protein [Aurantiacibacter odishensis]|uniref:hypothetical protein n=1 Tax=Aurantiacibacter odishensis TaxID=1155476 RepID=UPI000E764FA8|nr:hypothetical protein [Aurantiacibacter odishensis]